MAATALWCIVFEGVLALISASEVWATPMGPEYTYIHEETCICYDWKFDLPIFGISER